MMEILMFRYIAAAALIALVVAYLYPLIIRSGRKTASEAQEAWEDGKDGEDTDKS